MPDSCDVDAKSSPSHRDPAPPISREERGRKDRGRKHPLQLRRCLTSHHQPTHRDPAPHILRARGCIEEALTHSAAVTSPHTCRPYAHTRKRQVHPIHPLHPSIYAQIISNTDRDAGQGIRTSSMLIKRKRGGGSRPLTAAPVANTLVPYVAVQNVPSHPLAFRCKKSPHKFAGPTA